MLTDTQRTIVETYASLAYLLDGGLNQLKAILLTSRIVEDDEAGRRALGSLRQVAATLGEYRSIMAEAGPEWREEHRGLVVDPFCRVVRRMTIEGDGIPRLDGD